MSDVLLYGALAGLAAVVISSTTKGKQAANTVIDTIKPMPTVKPQKPVVINPKPVVGAVLPVLPSKPAPSNPQTPAKPPPTTPVASKPTKAVPLPAAAEPFRAQIKAAAFGQNLPFTLLAAFCEVVNPRFDTKYAVTDRRLLSSKAVIDSANGNTVLQENLATRYGLTQIALIHAQQGGYKGSPAQLFAANTNLEQGAKYLKKCLGLFTTSDRQIRAFVAYLYGYETAKNPSAEQLATAKKIYARWQELEA